MNFDLTDKERDVLQLIWDGMTDEKIANVLGISASHTRNIQDRMRLKLHCTNRVQLVRKGLEKGLLQL